MLHELITPQGVEKIDKQPWKPSIPASKDSMIFWIKVIFDFE